LGNVAQENITELPYYETSGFQIHVSVSKFQQSIRVQQGSDFQ
jgi:hypothetical protein